MISMNVSNEVLCLKDIRVEELPHILRWYNAVGEFRFATGVDRPITLDRLKKMHAQILMKEDEFFTGIHLKMLYEPVGVLIGILKGKMSDSKDSCGKVQGGNTVWMSLAAVDPAYRNRGYGKMSVQLLLAYLKMSSGVQKAFLAVEKENERGIRFWSANSFKTTGCIRKHAGDSGCGREIFIMCRDLGSRNR